MSAPEVARGDELRQSDDYRGWPVLDRTGQRVGDVDAVFEDAAGQPRYLGLPAGPLGGSHTVIPVELVEIAEADEEVRTPFTRERIRSGPRHDDGEPFGAELTRAIHEHFARTSEEPDETTMVRSEEELHVRTRDERYGAARLRKSVELEEVTRQVPVHADFVEMQDLAVPDPEADSGQIEQLTNGDVSVPVFEERLVVRKELVVTKRVVLARTRHVVREETVSDVLRRERIEFEFDRHPQEVERLASALAGEDLSLGPTPRTRHPAGGRDAARDTTQGPTPETRQAMRLSKDAGAGAAGEPASDRPTRRPGGGTQDRTTAAHSERRVLDVDPDSELISVEESPDRIDPQPTTSSETKES